MVDGPGSPVGAFRRTRLFWSPALLLSAQILSAALSCKAQHAFVSKTSPVPVVQLNLTRETETERGECAILFSRTNAPRPLDKNRQRQLCFALQGYGFLTRHSRIDDNRPSKWSDDVCMLLSFCGDDCHRLYGHPQQTPAVLNALSEAAAFAAGPISDFSSSLEEQGFPQKAKQVVPSNVVVAGLEDRQALTADAQPTTSDEKALQTALHSKGLGKDDDLSLSPEPFAPTGRSAGKCHFMSRASSGGCRKMYTLDFEVQYQAFGRFLARIALLLGAADIQKVAEIERQLEQYIHVKRRRALMGPPMASSTERQRRDREVNRKDPPALQSVSMVPKEAFRGATYSAAHQLDIVLEPLLPNGSAAGALGAPAPTIQILIPSNFKASVSPVQQANSPNGPARRLRGTINADPEKQPKRKPASAEAAINSAAHCRAAAAFMSMRTELSWLQDHVYFLQQHQ